MTKVMHIGDELDELNGFESVKSLVEKILAWGEEKGVGISKIVLNLNSSEDLKELEEEELRFRPHSMPEFLLSPGIDPLESLTEKDRWSLIEMLLSKGLNVNEVINDNQQTLVHQTAFGGFPDILKSLVALGADLHAKGEDDSNALHFAVASGLSSSKDETIEWLIDQGVDSKARSQMMGRSAENLMEILGGEKWLAKIAARDLAQKEALALNEITASVTPSSAEGSSAVKRATPSL